MIHIGIDAMGGDYAPNEVIKGVKHFLYENVQEKNLDEQHIHIIGDEQIILPALKKCELDSHRITVVHASQNIEFNDSPTKALKEKPNTPINVGYRLLANNKIDAFISSGNTGAILVGAHTTLKLLPNIIRPTIAVLVPLENNNYSIMLDVGSNIECRPDQMNQLGIIGSVYMEVMHNKKKPLVGLLNVGEEPKKGRASYVASYKLLSENTKINFFGNIEGRDILTGTVDVIICDGFVGNIVLKLLESAYTIFELGNSKKAHLRNMNFELRGGVPILGIDKVVIVGHGVSTFVAFSNMIQSARNLVKDNLCGKLKNVLT